MLSSILTIAGLVLGVGAIGLIAKRRGMFDFEESDESLRQSARRAREHHFAV